MITIHILIILVSLFHNVLSQVGTDCATNEDCNPHQTCQFGYCNCEFGYVKSIPLQHCFEIKKHGQECYFDIQCNDHRMECKYDNEERELKHCVCDRFHKWSEELKECYQNFNVSELLRNLGDGNDFGGHLERESEKTFLGMVIIGLVVVSLLLSLIAVCFVYSCCCVHKKASGGYVGPTRKEVEEVAVVGVPGMFDDMDGDMGMDFGF